ncbi:MAG: D-arabinose 5-phosphate isomerase [Pseudomonadota bacterium]
MIQQPTPTQASVKPATVHTRLLSQGIDVLRTEARAIVHLAEKLDQQFVLACQALFACQGRVLVMGMGKSGHIGKKMAATFSSTGTPAFFIHPAEAAHGDFGLITPQDTLLVLSNSGETPEIITLLPLLKRMGIHMTLITGNANSTLANHADITLDIGVTKEACPLGLAPTTSTTTSLALGDALALALLELRGFTQEDFAYSHPGGRLGRRLLLRISDLMHTGENIPTVLPSQTIGEALLEMTRARLGMTLVVSPHNPKKLIGIFTDGDLRRALENKSDVYKTIIASVLRPSYTSIQVDQLATEALHLMEQYRINALPVLDHHHELVGALNLHDLLQSGIL